MSGPKIQDHRNEIKTFKLGGLQEDGRQQKQEIETYVSQIDGVDHVLVNLEQGTVTINFDPGAIHPDYLQGTLRSLGHDILPQ